MILTPTIIDNSAALSITMAGAVTYEEFLNSLGRDYYRIVNYYISTQTEAQLQESITFKIIDSDGRQFLKQISTSLDPYQKQITFINDLSDSNILLNGLSSFDFIVRAGESIVLDLCMDAYKITDGLDKFGSSNYFKVDDDLKNLSIYFDDKSFCSRQRATIIIKNNTNFSVPLELFKLGTDPNDPFNASSQFVYDATCEGFTGQTELTIQSRKVGTIPYTNTTVQLSAGTIEAVMDALNSLEIGFWTYYTSGASQYIVGFSSTHQFNALIINNPAPGIDTDYELYSFFNTTGGMQYFANCFELNNLLNPQSIVDAYNHPIGTLIKVVFTGGNVFPMSASIIRLDGVTPTTIYSKIVNLGQVEEFTFSILGNSTTKYFVNFLEPS